MKISDIDKNFDVKPLPGIENAEWVNAKKSPIKVYGLGIVEEGKNFMRMPFEIAKSVSEGVGGLSWHTAGGRIRFRTNSGYVGIRADMTVGQTMPHITMIGQSGFDMYRSDNGKHSFVGAIVPWSLENGMSGALYTDGKWHTYTIDMPLYDSVKDVFLGFAPGSEVEEAEPYTIEKPVVYYGSSITQGGCASRPGNSYEAMISRMLDCNYINMGFSGNACGEKAMAEYLAGIDTSVLVCDYDYNAPSAAHLRNTHFAFYAAYREKQPETPIVFISKANIDFNNPDDCERRKIITETFLKAKSMGDRNVYFIDGADIYDGPFAGDCTVDGTHPSDLGFSKMAVAIGKVLKNILF